MAEIIREKIFQQYREEVPYCTSVCPLITMPSSFYLISHMPCWLNAPLRCGGHCAPPVTGDAVSLRSGATLPDTAHSMFCYQVQVLDYKERSGGAKDLVQVVVYVEQESQKGIILGRGASALKAMATAARADIEEFVGGVLIAWLLVLPTVLGMLDPGMISRPLCCAGRPIFPGHDSQGEAQVAQRCRRRHWPWLLRNHSTAKQCKQDFTIMSHCVVPK